MKGFGNNRMRECGGGKNGMNGCVGKNRMNGCEWGKDRVKLCVKGSVMIKGMWRRKEYDVEWRHCKVSEFGRRGSRWCLTESRTKNH